MYKNKFYFIYLLLLISVLVVSGCNSGSPSSIKEEQEKSKLEQIKDSGTLRVATFTDMMGWGSLDESGEYVGYDPDIARAIAKDLGVEVEFVPINTVDRIPVLQTDNADVAIAAFTPTEERAESVTFTQPYAAVGMLPIFKKGTEVNQIEDIADKKISVTRGSTPDAVVTELFPDADIYRYDSMADSITALTTGKVEVFFDTQSLGVELSNKDPELEVMQGNPIALEYISMGIQQSEDNEWLDYLNEWIKEFTESGKNTEWYEKWFSSPLPDFNDPIPNFIE